MSRCHNRPIVDLDMLFMHEDSFREQFGPRLLRLRERRGFDAAECALRTGLSRDALTNYESGRNVPPYATMIRLALVLAVSLDDLVDWPTIRRLYVRMNSDQEAA